MTKLQHAIDRIEKLNHKIKRIDLYGELYNYSVKFLLGFALEEGEYIEVTMIEIYGQNLCDYNDEIINFYDKFSSKYTNILINNYNIPCDSLGLNITKEK